jgi:hypothetical protein
MDRTTMHDLVQLDRTTDRILPNGVCLLPPTRSCDKGNACYTCGLFATDQSFTDVHREMLDRTRRLVSQRQAQHQQRTGQPMTDTNVWLQERLQEIAAVERILDRLEQHPDGERSLQGGGVAARTGSRSTRPVPVEIIPRPTA